MKQIKPKQNYEKKFEIKCNKGIDENKLKRIIEILQEEN